MKVNANIILARCSTPEELYGMRVEERNGDWIRTWAFAVSKEMAGRDSVTLPGEFFKKNREHLFQGDRLPIEIPR